MAFQVSHINIITVIYRPNIFVVSAMGRFGRAGVSAFVGAGKEYLRISGEEIGASCPPFSSTDQLGLKSTVAFICIHIKNLVAALRPGWVFALEGKIFSIKTPVCFSVCAVESKLVNIL